MQTPGFPVALLLLEASWVLHGSPPVPPEVLPPRAQENFDLDKLLGQWYEVAVVSSCPHYMVAQRDDPGVVRYQLQVNHTQDLVHMRGTAPGWVSFSLWVMLSTEQPSGVRSTLVKLYGREAVVSEDTMAEYRTLVRNQGLRDDLIIIKENKASAADNMCASQILVCVVVLGLWWKPLQGLPAFPEPGYIQENNLSSAMGQWYLLGLGSSFSLTEWSKGEAISTMEIMPGLEAGSAIFKRSQSDLDYVVHTRYQEYAVMIARPKVHLEEPNIYVLLYSRTRTLRETAWAHFRSIVRDMGLDTIIAYEDTGKCLGTAGVAAKEDFVPRYFYNTSSMSCHEFQYGGCMGNQNNFVAEKECLQRCRTEAACRLPLVAQPCVGQPPVWAFDSQAGVCVTSMPGFCQGNGNQFYSQRECGEVLGRWQQNAGNIRTGRGSDITVLNFRTRRTLNPAEPDRENQHQ
ncbi:hypothetical protein NHX12_027532, partial [Muraenolepis orangiensis]